MKKKMRKHVQPSKQNNPGAINTARRKERAEMRELGLKSMKAYRKYQKKQRRDADVAEG